MAVTNHTISVTTAQSDTKVDGQRGVLIINDGPDDVFLSFDTPITVVTTGAGLKADDPPLSVNDTLTTLRAKTSSGTATLRVWALK